MAGRSPSDWASSSRRGRFGGTACGPFRSPSAPDLARPLVIHRLAVTPLLFLLLLQAASLPATAAGFTASTTSPGNVLGTIAVAPPSALTATPNAGGSVGLSWSASPTATLRAVEYVLLRRPSGSGPFAEVARTAALTYTDAPTPGTYDYAVRTVISTFTSADTAVATVTTTP